MRPDKRHKKEFSLCVLDAMRKLVLPHQRAEGETIVQQTNSSDLIKDIRAKLHEDASSFKIKAALATLRRRKLIRRVRLDRSDYWVVMRKE